ncbi:unnamed protein product [Lactuca virosa]|uniref:Uncharacterized protein n=1 Tax=Lactuca virosa TaxID=75947 RepID=A0AAU9PIY4_9ASTR|nr:unnamed protein product [Lactuca virosa]
MAAKYMGKLGGSPGLQEGEGYLTQIFQHLLSVVPLLRSPVRSSQSSPRKKKCQDVEDEGSISQEALIRIRNRFYSKLCLQL